MGGCCSNSDAAQHDTDNTKHKTRLSSADLKKKELEDKQKKKDHDRDEKAGSGRKSQDERPSSSARRRRDADSRSDASSTSSSSSTPASPVVGVDGKAYTDGDGNVVLDRDELGRKIVLDETGSPVFGADGKPQYAAKKPRTASAKARRRNNRKKEGQDYGTRVGDDDEEEVELLVGGKFIKIKTTVMSPDGKPQKRSLQAIQEKMSRLESARGELAKGLKTIDELGALGDVTPLLAVQDECTDLAHLLDKLSNSVEGIEDSDKAATLVHKVGSALQQLAVDEFLDMSPMQQQRKAGAIAQLVTATQQCIELAAEERKAMNQRAKELAAESVARAVTDTRGLPDAPTSSRPGSAAAGQSEGKANSRSATPSGKKPGTKPGGKKNNNSRTSTPTVAGRRAGSPSSPTSKQSPGGKRVSSPIATTKPKPKVSSSPKPKVSSSSPKPKLSASSSRSPTSSTATTASPKGRAVNSPSSGGRGGSRGGARTVRNLLYEPSKEGEEDPGTQWSPHPKSKFASPKRKPASPKVPSCASVSPKRNNRAASSTSASASASASRRPSPKRGAWGSSSASGRASSSPAAKPSSRSPSTRASPSSRFGAAGAAAAGGPNKPPRAAGRVKPLNPSCMMSSSAASTSTARTSRSVTMGASAAYHRRMKEKTTALMTMQKKKREPTALERARSVASAASRRMAQQFSSRQSSTCGTSRHGSAASRRRAQQRGGRGGFGGMSEDDSSQIMPTMDSIALGAAPTEQLIVQLMHSQRLIRSRGFSDMPIDAQSHVIRMVRDMLVQCRAKAASDDLHQQHGGSSSSPASKNTQAFLSSVEKTVARAENELVKNFSRVGGGGNGGGGGGGFGPASPLSAGRRPVSSSRSNYNMTPNFSRPSSPYHDGAAGGAGGGFHLISPSSAASLSSSPSSHRNRRHHHSNNDSNGATTITPAADGGLAHLLGDDGQPLQYGFDSPIRVLLGAYKFLMSADFVNALPYERDQALRLIRSQLASAKKVAATLPEERRLSLTSVFLRITQALAEEKFNDVASCSPFAASSSAPPSSAASASSAARRSRSNAQRRGGTTTLKNTVRTVNESLMHSRRMLCSPGFAIMGAESQTNVFALVQEQIERAREDVKNGICDDSTAERVQQLDLVLHAVRERIEKRHASASASASSSSASAGTVLHGHHDNNNENLATSPSPAPVVGTWTKDGKSQLSAFGASHWMFHTVASMPE